MDNNMDYLCWLIPQITVHGCIIKKSETFNSCHNLVICNNLCSRTNWCLRTICDHKSVMTTTNNLSLNWSETNNIHLENHTRIIDYINTQHSNTDKFRHHFWSILRITHTLKQMLRNKNIHSLHYIQNESNLKLLTIRNFQSICKPLHCHDKTSTLTIA